MTRAGEFTARIARRYRFGLEPWSPLGMPLVVHNVRISRGGDQYTSTASFLFEPRIRLAVARELHRLEGAEQRHAGAPVGTAPAEPRFIRPGGEAATRVAEVLRRRAVRVEVVPRADLPVRENTSQPSGSVLPSPLLPLANRGSVESSASPRERPLELARPVEAPVQRPSQQPVPPLELARITDAVMSTLNRRLAAERERVGRR